MLKGNVPILATAFTEQGELDLASVETPGPLSVAAGR
jgi:hypothetical protein